MAFEVGADASAVATLGYLYLPVSAGLSSIVFRSYKRRYGQLEWLSLTMLTLAAVGFILLRERRNPTDHGPGSLNSTVRDFGFEVVNAHTRDVSGASRAPQGEVAQWWEDYVWGPLAQAEGLGLILLAVLASSLATILAERIYKGRSLGLLRADEASHRFPLFKFYLDAATLLFNVIIWFSRPHLAKLFPVIPDDEAMFGRWGRRHYVMVLVMVGQGWCAGLVCKRFNTVVKSIAQTLSTISAVLISDPLLGMYDFQSRALPSMAKLCFGSHTCREAGPKSAPLKLWTRSAQWT